MPSKHYHQAFGLTLGLITGLCIYKVFSEVMLFTVCALMSSRFPDYLEKPVNKYHRGFFHSKTFLLILIIALIYLSVNPLSGLILGYLSHLLLDYSFRVNKVRLH